MSARIADENFSLVQGVGTGLCLLTALLVSGEYFEKRKALALGITAAGSGVGQLIVPYILRFLFDEMGFSNTMLLYGRYLKSCILITCEHIHVIGLFTIFRLLICSIFIKT